MKKSSFWKTSRGLQALILIGAVSFSLVIDHREHFFEWLPFIILALCPLMHIFMHGGHGQQSNDNNDLETESAAYERGLEEGRRQGHLSLNGNAERKGGEV